MTNTNDTFTKTKLKRKIHRIPRDRELDLNDFRLSYGICIPKRCATKKQKIPKKKLKNKRYKAND